MLLLSWLVCGSVLPFVIGCSGVGCVGLGRRVLGAARLRWWPLGCSNVRLFACLLACLVVLVFGRSRSSAFRFGYFSSGVGIWVRVSVSFLVRGWVRPFVRSFVRLVGSCVGCCGASVVAWGNWVLWRHVFTWLRVSAAWVYVGRALFVVVGFGVSWRTWFVCTRV